MSWRDTLFIWRGRYCTRNEIAPATNERPFNWRGTWIGVDAGGTLKPDAPEIEALAEEGLPRFNVSGWLDRDRTKGFFSGDYRSYASTIGDDDEPDRMATRPGIGWQLDQGDGAGLTWFDDDYQLIRVDGDDVFAVGRNEFGPFVSAGVASGYSFQREAIEGKLTESESRVVVMARRYLDEEDARAKMSLDEWAAEARRDRARGVHPWNVPAMASKLAKATPAFKKRRT